MNHPTIERTLRTGYPEREETVVIDHPVEDMYGYEIKAGDTYFTDRNGRNVLETNMEDYLIEEVDVKFHTAGRD